MPRKPRTNDPSYKKVEIGGMDLRAVENKIHEYRIKGYTVEYLDIKSGVMMLQKRKGAGTSVKGARYRWTERDDKELLALMKAYPNADFVELSARFIPERTPKSLFVRARLLGVDPGGRRVRRDTIRKAYGDEYEQGIS